MKKNVDNRDYRYVYFIENHIDTSKIEIKISKKLKEADDLQIVHQDVFHNEYKSFVISVYRFKIYPSRIKTEPKKKFQVDIKLKVSKNEKYNSKLTIDNIKNDSFIFDFKFNSAKGWVLVKDPPESFPFDLIQQFEIYLYYIKNILKIKNQLDLENQYFILSSQKLLIGEGIHYQFSFYLYIFLECFASPLVQRHLTCFKPEKIKGIGTISQAKLNQMTNILKTFENKPEKVLDNIENKNNVQECGVKLFTIILLFNFIFHKERMNELLNDEKNKAYIFQGLLNFGKLFKNLELNKEHINYLLKIAVNFSQMKNSLKYTKNLNLLLNVIIDNYEKLYQLYKSEEVIYKNNYKNGIPSEYPRIDVEEIVIPDKDDNMKEIGNLYKSLIAIQQGDFFIIFNYTFFEKYVLCFNEVNLDNLFYMKDIINFSKLNINKFDLKINIDKMIHDNGLLFVKKGELKNLKLLDFIKRDDFYTAQNYNKSIYRSLDILNGLDISEFNEQFYLEWKTINWNDIFNDQYF